MKKISICFLLGLIIMSGCGNTVEYSQTVDDIISNVASSSEAQNYDEKEDNADKIYVSVLGEVIHPGVYIVLSGSRMYEVLNAAGGVTDKADISGINLVGFAEDGMQINVPIMADDGYVNKDGAVISTNHDGMVNINTASEDELKSITGIGDTRAKAIVDFRNRNGKFNTIEDIMLVSGIKETIFEKIKDKIYVD